MPCDSKKRPNVLFLLSDQHNARALGCYGNNEVHTPNLDRLASEGVRFSNAYVQSTICTPSRMCYSSGQYVHNFGYYGLLGRCPGGLPSIFSYMKKHGYRTGAAGRIHTPTGWLGKDLDYVRDGYGSETSQNSLDLPSDEEYRAGYEDHYHAYLAKKGLAELRDDIYIPEWYEKHGTTSGQGLDARYSYLSEDDTIDAWTAECANEFIGQCHKTGEPFFFWMSMPRPHQTYLPAKKFWDLYESDSLTLPPNSENDMKGRHPSAQAMQRLFKNDESCRIYEPKDWDSFRRRVLHGYYACVSQVDDAVGRVLSKLDELGIRENTIVVYTADHGEFAGEHGMIEKAPGIGFRCVTRVPHIWSWPGHLPENAERDGLVEMVDFLPTVASLAGLPAPNWVDGLDITQMLVNGGDVREIAVTEGPLTKTLHTKRYKFTQYIPEMNDGEEFGELFDLESDPWELENLYFEPKYQQLVNELRYKLYCWLVRTTRNVTAFPLAPMPAGQKGYRLWDDADDLYDDDGKIGFNLLKRLIDEGALNYF